MPANPDRGRLHHRLGPALIAGLYVAVSVVYILVSDQLVNAMITDPVLNARVQSSKGIAFVTLSGLLIWALTARLVRSLRRANEELADRERRVRVLLDGAPVPLVVLRDGRFEYVNTEAARLLGGQAQLEACSLQSLLVGDAGERVQQLLERVAGHGVGEWLNDLRMRSTSGREFEAEIAATPFALDQRAMQVVILDVTERRQLELAVRQAQKMDAVGRLAAGVAHEFNNMLTVILGLSAMAKSEGPERECLTQIEEVAEQAAELTKSLLTMSRSAPSERRPASLRGLLGSVETVVRGVLPAEIKLECRFDDIGEVMVLADSSQIRQALVNLALNAKDAMPRGGVLRLSANAQPDGAMIEVSDTGTGMTPQVLSNIFTPFFTTKGAGKGTGLGLAVTRGIIEEHRGRIDVSSRVGQGTTFRITLPFADVAVAAR